MPPVHWASYLLFKKALTVFSKVLVLPGFCSLHSTSAWTFIAAPSSLQTCESLSFSLFFASPLSFLHIKKGCPLNKVLSLFLVYSSASSSNNIHTVRIPPCWLRCQGLDWTPDDSYSLNFTALLGDHAGTTMEAQDCAQQTFYSFCSFKVTNDSSVALITNSSSHFVSLLLPLRLCQYYSSDI